MLYFGPTSFIHNAIDYVTVAFYSSETGELIVNEPFEHYHFGASDTTGTHEGLDMRGEVALLTRNIVIKGTTTDGWGGQVLTADAIESDGKFRYGETVLEYVQVYNCSHRNTDRAAIRFEESKGAYGRLVGVSVHGSLGYGAAIRKANNVEVRDFVNTGSV